MRTSIVRRAIVALVPAVLALGIAGTSLAADPGITLVGTGSVPGDGSDKSGLTGSICQAGSLANCVPAAILGGFGSDVDFTGFNGVYVAAPDRGPFDGLTDVPYVDRVDYFHIATNVGAAFPNIDVTLLDTRALRDADGTPFVGSAADFARRLDPEGIRVSATGTMFVSDEYGPAILEFDRQGNLVRRIAIPADFAIANPSANPGAELLGNTSGRQANRGMEGLAVSPDGTTLYGIMQNALLQDNALTPGTTDRISVFTRILKVNIATGATAEYAYQLQASNRGQGVSEILAINDHELLVLERDNRSNLQTPPQAPTRKAIYKIDLAGATDVADVTLPAAAPLPAGVSAVSKSLFIDLLDPAYGLAATIPEKLEGLTWGPDLADGRHLLYVISDNDLDPAIATRIYAFAIDHSAAAVAPRTHAGPMFAPGQVNKIIGRE
jgi:hypothetical protein